MMGREIKPGAARLLGNIIFMCVISLWAAPTAWAAPVESPPEMPMPTPPEDMPDPPIIGPEPGDPGPGVLPCIPPAISHCTKAQQFANQLKQYVLELETEDFVEQATAEQGTIITEELVASYIAYLDAILAGHTPNDTTLPEKVLDFRHVESTLMQQTGFPFIIINFKPEDVYTEKFYDDIYGREEIEYMAKDGESGIGRMLDKFLDAITPIIGRETCGLSVCNREGDRVVAMLGGGLSSTKDSQYVDAGFRVTRFEHRHVSFTDRINQNIRRSLNYDSLGVWAKDSYWGAIWEEDEFDQFSVRDAVFIVGGRNPIKPMESGTWRGLAIGTESSASATEMRVGHSEVTVNLDTSKVDVAITGITEGTSGTVNVKANGATTTISVAALTTLEWKGIPLYRRGLFEDSRSTGIVSTLDDVLGSILPPEGDNIKNTYDTIRGQFYGAAGEEVVGVFRKSGYVGSFGAYKK